jgi:putative ABC transport system permease protein
MRSFAQLFRDFRYGSRSLRKSPGLAAAAIATLALGIGANTAIFSVLQGVVLDPLPYQQPDRLVVVALYNRSLGSPTYLSYPDFLDWQLNSRSFKQIAAFANEGFDMTGPGEPEHLDGKEVSAGFFSTLNIRLAVGRGFSPDEDQIGGSPAVSLAIVFGKTGLGAALRRWARTLL